MDAYILEWLNLGLRWLHVIAGVAWIGASFYFVMLDNSLDAAARSRRTRSAASTASCGRVHGGGFYSSQKYLAGPKGEPLADESPLVRSGRPTRPGCPAWACSRSSTGAARTRT